ncbi:unnamed protein product [Chondrus crispus]|uniref:Uncharacterized protein n=1 Tax=Chondrus crispus TaxID=2769 RepID=R7QEE7_CHOCR|nr:unnamed protein product [Chondrus crispus]CDF36138.1 unnamed protein product [Chondrus crispus]|eukprot:XP_005715957.1 unnamed protein product [Chondrus crispus]
MRTLIFKLSPSPHIRTPNPSTSMLQLTPPTLTQRPTAN